MAKKDIKEEVLELKQQPGKGILVGSPGLIVTSMNLNLADEFQISVQAIISGKGLSLLKNITDRINLKLLKTKTYSCGAITLYYGPTKK